MVSCIRRRKISRSGFSIAEGNVRMIVRGWCVAVTFGIFVRLATLLIYIGACASNSVSIMVITALRL